MKSLLSRVKKSDVVTDPFPHIVVADPIEDDLSWQLLSEFPDINMITEDKDFRSNQRFTYPGSQALSSEHISPLWKEFIRANTSSTFLDQFVQVFEEHIRQIYPSFESDIGALSTLKPGIKEINTFSTADVLLLPDLCINTPVFGIPSAVRSAHLDLPNKLFVGLYYLRSPQDTSTGGDLEIYKFKRGRPYGLRERASVGHRYIELVKTIKYQRNVLVLFLNSIHSVHGVTVRSNTDLPRNFFFLAGEVKQPLFDFTPYEDVKFKLKKVLKERLGRVQPLAGRALSKVSFSKARSVSALSYAKESKEY